MNVRMLLAALAWICVMLAGPSPSPCLAREDARTEKARHILDEHLSKLKVRNAVVTFVEDKAVRGLFPNEFIFGVRFRMYPVAISPPEPLKSQNLIVVHGEMVAELRTLGDLSDWLRRNLDSQPAEAGRKQSVRAFLALANELKQDGFYKFELREDSLGTRQAGEFQEAFGRTAVISGGKGELSVRLGFDNRGIMNYANWADAIMPGPRPICQATKLLDRDPIVRKMAEQDILVMGRPAKPYLDEQRAKANPRLREAIDRIWKRIVDEGW